MKRTWFTALSLWVTPVLLLSAGPLSATAQNPQPPTIELIGQIGGTANAIAVQGNYAYVGIGSRLAVVDVSDPAHPAIIGQTGNLSTAEVMAVTVVGNYAYVANSYAGLRIVNVLNPAHPAEVGFFRTPAGHSRGVAIRGNYAYVAEQFGGLRIVAVSDPAHPVEVGSDAILKDASDVVVVGSTAYVTDLRGGLYILNVADPAHPAEVGRYSPPGFAGAVAVAGNMAYVTASSAGLRVVSVADPAHPAEVGSYDTPGTAMGVAVAGDLAYVADIESLRIVSVADPAHPAEVAFYATPGQAMGVAVAGDLIYVAAGTGGLVILRLRAPGPPPSGAFTLAQGAGLPAVASLPGSDRFLVVWDTGAGLSARFVDSAGQPVGPEFVPTAPDTRIGIPAVAANPAAREFLVTWWHFRKPTGGIFGQLLTADGSLIGGRFMISGANSRENWPPAVAYNSHSGEYLVAWYQDEPSGSHVYGQRVASDGRPVGDVFAVNREGLQARPAVAASDATGEYLVVWSRLDLGLGGNLFGQRLGASGEPIGGAITIGQGDKPAVTYNRVSGEYLVTWANGTAQAARVRPDGSVVGGIALSAPGGGRNFSKVASDSAGGYMVVWEGPDGGENLSNVFGRELSSTGEPRSIQLTLDDRPSSGQLLYPAMAYNAQANVYLIAWESRIEGEQAVRTRIYQPGQAPPPPGPSGLVNGDFEDGFYPLVGQSIANGWGPYTLVGKPSFAGERFTVHSGRWAYKVSGFAPFTAGLAQVVPVQPGRTYRITAYYQLYPPGDGQAFLEVRDGTSATRWVGDNWPGVWRPLSQVVTATSDRLLITLQGNNGAVPNANVYFDDVTVVAVGAP